jgi:hypothetical protein
MAKARKKNAKKAWKEGSTNPGEGFGMNEDPMIRPLCLKFQ